MFNSIPRGIIYHTLWLDVVSLFKAVWAKIDDSAPIAELECKFAENMSSGNCVIFPFARSAIYYTLKTQDFPKGSEIIMPPISIKPILEVILLLGLKPVFVDIDPKTLCFDSENFKNAINKNTKAVLITYLYGIVPDIEKFLTIAKDLKLFVIEDFSHNLNAKYKDKKVGSFGDVGVYSASSVKTFDTYGGGFAITNNSFLAEKLRKYQKQLKPTSRIALLKKIVTSLIRNFATQRLSFSVMTLPLIKIMKRLSPEKFLKYTGGRSLEITNKIPQEWLSSFTSLQAKVGLKILTQVELEDKIRIANVEKIKESLKSKGILTFPENLPDARNVYWQFVSYPKDALQLQDYLHKYNIDTATTSLSLLSMIDSHQTSTPNAENIHKNALFIPAYPKLKEKDILYISKALLDFIDSNLG